MDPDPDVSIGGSADAGIGGSASAGGAVSGGPDGPAVDASMTGGIGAGGYASGNPLGGPGSSYTPAETYKGQLSEAMQVMLNLGYTPEQAQALFSDPRGAPYPDQNSIMAAFGMSSPDELDQYANTIGQMFTGYTPPSGWIGKLLDYANRAAQGLNSFMADQLSGIPGVTLSPNAYAGTPGFGRGGIDQPITPPSATTSNDKVDTATSATTDKTQQTSSASGLSPWVQQHYRNPSIPSPWKRMSQGLRGEGAG